MNAQLKGGLRIRNKRLLSSGTLGAAVIGAGWPTNPGWKYLVSNAHVLADSFGNYPDDQIDQPTADCSPNGKIGNMGGIWGQGIPSHLKVRTNNYNNPNHTDAAVAYLTSHDALVAEIKGIGNPGGAIDPPQNGWCGKKTGFRTGTTTGCIWTYPQILTMTWTDGQPATFDDVFFANNPVDSGDSGALWLDNGAPPQVGPRVHGMLFAGTRDDTGYLHGAYQRWLHVQQGWTAYLNTAP